MLIDSHCHLDKAHRKGELASLLKRAAGAGVGRVIAVGTNVTDWSLYRDLAAAHPGVIDYTVGLHPTSVEDDWLEQVMQVSTFFAEVKEPVALGEIGLDYYHMPKFPDEAAEVRANRLAAFRRQLEIALQLDCPVVVHSRESFRECISVIDESGVDWNRVVFHCFSEGPEEMRILNERGGRASFTGIVTYKSAENVRQAVLAQGLDRLMVETDAPYLSPVPHRGKPNEPAFVTHTAAFCAELFGISPEELAAQTTANAIAFFGLE